MFLFKQLLKAQMHTVMHACVRTHAHTWMWTHTDTHTHSKVNSFKCQSCLYSLWDQKCCRQRILKTLLPALPAQRNNPTTKNSHSAEEFLAKSKLSKSSKFYFIYFSTSVGPFFFLLGLFDNTAVPWARLVRGCWALYKSIVITIIIIFINLMHITLSQKKEKKKKSQTRMTTSKQYPIA